MSRDQVRSGCPVCTWTSVWGNDLDDAYREGLAHQLREHPRVVRIEERVTDD